MPQFPKWLTSVAAATPVNRVARRALQVRLRAVQHYLEALNKKSELAETIHQLRIWTRRAGAALRLFGALAPRRECRKLKRRLRKLRRLGGAVRDCDVLLASWEARDAQPPREVAAALRDRRRTARKKLLAIRKKLLRGQRFNKQADRLLKQLEWPKRHSNRIAPPFAAWCRVQLVPLGEGLLPLAGGKLAQDEELHALRIAAKRLRYALELAPAAISAQAHQRLYDALSELQDRLGRVCDHAAAAERLAEWRSESKSRGERRALKAALASEERQLAAERQKFHRWWTAARRKRLRMAWTKALGK